MRLGLAVLAGMTLYGQSLPTGFVRGVVVDRIAGQPESDFNLKTPSDTVYRFHCDGKTWIERAHERAGASGLRAGELLEVVSDRDANPAHPVHYARMVQVITTQRTHPHISDGVYRMLSHNEQIITRIRDYNYSGIVIQIEREKLVLRTRLDGEKTIFLLPDTRCLMQGSEVEAAKLRPNTRVFVEAGADASNRLEAYRVIWGGILQPAW